MELKLDYRCEKRKVECKDIPFDKESIRSALNETVHVQFGNGFEWVRIYSGSDGFSVSTWSENYTLYEKFDDAWEDFESYAKGLMK